MDLAKSQPGERSFKLRLAGSTAGCAAEGPCRIESIVDHEIGGDLATKQEKLDLLSAVPLFSDLSNTDLERIMSTAKETYHNAGDSIVTEGRGGVGFHLIIDGEANVIRGGRTVAKLAPGEFFGEMALVDDAPRSASVVAESDLTTIVISKWEFRPLVKSHPELAWKLIEHLVARVREEQTGRDALIC